MISTRFAIVSAGLLSIACHATAVPQWWQSEAASESYNCKQKPFKRVVTFSVDGMHSSDVEKWVALKPNSNISRLLNTGYEFTDAYTTAPSDSFPGQVAQFTGGLPRTTGVWYDDIWDRSYYPPSSGCPGAPGAEVAYDESKDYNSTELFSGGIDPANLPQLKIKGKCDDMYPHNRLRVNTVQELVVDAGKQTAYTDKHPAYDIVRGPSGDGLTVGYFPEIAAVATTVDATIGYDQLHVNAWLDWIDAKTPAHSEGSLTEVPTLFGGNFQAMSVAQKTVGYNNDSSNSFSDAIVQAMTFVDASIGAVVDKLKSKGLLDETLVIVASKHGQTPIDRALYGKINPKIITNLTGVPVMWQTSDDIALIFLNHSSDTQKAADNLNAHRAEGKIRAVIYGANLTASGFGDPLKDPAIPDIIVQPELGIIYTTSTAKIAEHGGISDDDRKVACFVSSPSLKKMKYNGRVETRQIAPTILTALGLDVSKLQGAVKDKTKVLPGFY